ncbi:MAG: phytanoyl-CoA dioxygenase family protein [Gemmatimonadales bacterium]
MTRVTGSSVPQEILLVRVPLKTFVRDQVRRNTERLGRPIRIARGYKEYAARRALAESIPTAECWDVSSLSAEGYLIVPGMAAGVAELITASRDKLAHAQNLPQSRNKAFFSQLLEAGDRGLDTIFTRFALTDKVLNTTARYLGVAPFLESVELLYSKPVQGPPAQSQQWHKDRTDRKILKVFVYINDVTPKHGPLSLLPRSQSEKVPEFLFHYLTDDEMARYADLSKVVALTGAAGTTILIDTQTSYHLGSRCQEPRLAYVAYFSSGFGYRARETRWIVDPAALSPLSPLQRYALGAS